MSGAENLPRLGAPARIRAVGALARGAHMPAGHPSRLAYGEWSYGYLMTQRIERATALLPSCVAKQVTRPIRNREARVTEPQLV